MSADIEEAIFQRLLVPLRDLGVRVEVFPDEPRRLQGAAPNKLVLVRYQGSKSQPPAGNNPLSKAPINQQRFLRFEISLLIKDLRTHKNVYIVRDQVMALLSGFVPANSKRALYHLQDGFVQLFEGIWFYAMVFELPELTSYTTI